MQINNGTLTFGKDRHGYDEITATSHLEPKSAPFHTTSAAIHWLWLIDERVTAQRHRTNAKSQHHTESTQ